MAMKIGTMALAIGAAAWTCMAQEDVKVAIPQAGVALSIYDRGFALVNQPWRVNAAAGENRVRFVPVPDRVEMSSVWMTPRSRDTRMESLALRLEPGPRTSADLMRRWIGGGVNARMADGQEWKGLLEAALGEESIVLRPEGAGVVDLNRERMESVQRIDGTDAPLASALEWRMRASKDAFETVRLSYLVDGIGWDVSYEGILSANGRAVDLAVRGRVENRTGGSFDRARVRLVSTGIGLARGEAGEGILPGAGGRRPGMLRYAYGDRDVRLDRQAAAAGRVHTFDVPETVSLSDGEDVYVQLVSAPEVPVNRFYVYDGVVFDAYDRNRRTDWSYGTACRNGVESFVEVANTPKEGLGMPLPPGRWRLYVESADTGLELAGEGFFGPIEPGQTAQVLLGPARGLRGERERTGYAEVVPLREYEESFAIRLENDTEQDVEIRVVEHLYRWPQYEIVKADTKYENAGEQVIEFRPAVKAGGRRSIHYTVRYRW